MKINFIQRGLVIALILIITISFHSVITTGYDTPPIKTLERGDFVILFDVEEYIENWWEANNPGEPFPYYQKHSAVYVGEGEHGIHWFMEAGPATVHYALPSWLAFVWGNRSYWEVKYVTDLEIENAVNYMERWRWWDYQDLDQGDYDHWYPRDEANCSNEALKEKINTEYIPKFTCSEFIWAGYMWATAERINIPACIKNPPEPGERIYGETC